MGKLKETVCHETVISISLNSSIHRLVDKKMDNKPRFDVETPGANILKVALCFHFHRASLCPGFSCCFFFFFLTPNCVFHQAPCHTLFCSILKHSLQLCTHTQAEKGAVSMQLKLSACVVLVPVQASAPFSPACIAAESDVQPRGKLISYCADLLFNLLSTSLVQ